MTTGERAVRVTLDTQQAAYVALLNEYLALLSEAEALKEQLAVAMTVAGRTEEAPCADG